MCFHNLFTTSSTFSLVEVTAEYLDSQASCTLPCIFVLCSIMDKNPSAVSPSLPQTLTWGWLQAQDSAWKPWYCPTGLMQHMPWHNLCCHKLPSVSSPHTEKKKKNQCYTAYSGNSHSLKTSFFLGFPKSLRFYHWEDYLNQKMSGFDIDPIYFQKRTKWAIVYILLPKNAKSNSPNTSKLLPDGG